MWSLVGTQTWNHVSWMKKWIQGWKNEDWKLTYSSYPKFCTVSRKFSSKVFVLICLFCPGSLKGISKWVDSKVTLFSFLKPVSHSLVPVLVNDNIYAIIQKKLNWFTFSIHFLFFIHTVHPSYLFLRQFRDILHFTWASDTVSLKAGCSTASELSNTFSAMSKENEIKCESDPISPWLKSP